jgi:hypothetical protein
VSRLNFLLSLILLCLFASVPVCAADPAAPIGPLKMFKRSPFTAEFELYSGGITGDSIGAAYKSATRGDFGVRFSFGFLKGVNFNLDYMYSNQSRSFTAVTPETGPLPSGTLLMRSGNGGRNLTLIVPVLGQASLPVFGGRAVTFNLGAGVKIYPFKHLGFRLDVRDHIAQGGTGTLNPAQDLTIQGNTLPNPQQYFGKIPVQNNLVFTLGLIFRIL